MSNEQLARTLLGFALVVVPVCYLVLLVVMLMKRAHWISFPTQFFLFGTVGGWCLTLALSPSGIAATFTVFMVLIYPVCLVSSLYLNGRKDRNGFDTVAMAGGYFYSAIPVVGFLAMSVFG